ncbi:MAG: T9SS type A sorting domain-containing protein [Flavobacteriales bacterium]|nr:T9SS type A sorting domain-containing protein [Flavobacteriales bacterium]
MTRFLFIVIGFLLIHCSLWAQEFQQIESAEYDPSQNRWLVSNSTSIIAQSETGVLSFFGDATASHGMEVMNGNLYAISGDLIKGYDLATGQEVFSLDVPGAGFLNGMGSDPASSRLWISDFSNNRIFELDVSDLENPVLDPIVTNTVSTPNGVVFDQFNNRVVFVNWGSNAAIKQIDLNNNTMTTIIQSGLANCDGIDIDENGDFFVSSWSPTRITKYSDNFSTSEIISAPGLSNPADISYGIGISTLGIANSGNETLTLIEFDPSSAHDITEKNAKLNIFPNPVSSASRVQFELNTAVDIDLAIRDAQGRLVQRLLSGIQPKGEHQVLLNGVNLESGHYFLYLSSGSNLSMQPFVVQD